MGTDQALWSSRCGFPLTAVLWELLLGDRTLEQAVAWLRELFEASGAATPTMASGAALLLSQPGHGVVLVEWSRSSLWVSPIAFEGVMVHANHCVIGSGLATAKKKACNGC